MQTQLLRTSCTSMTKKSESSLLSRTFTLALVGLALVVIPACGGGGGGSKPSAFQRGFNAGFAQDEDYFDGYDDSWLTRDDSPILYRGNDIPFIDDASYDAGFNDGRWTAYHDGYFVAYRSAFIIGFSEGYDNAFWPDYLNFLDLDIHDEWGDGGFDDGYNDGFSEGRIFGAFDYESALPFSWDDAFLDWQEGTDLYFEEVDLGTGDLGPVILYEWGTDPTLEKSAQTIRTRSTHKGMTMRRSSTEKSAAKSAEDLPRPLTTEQEEELSVTPSASLRDARDLRIEESWLERVDSVLTNEKSAPHTRRTR